MAYGWLRSQYMSVSDARDGDGSAHALVPTASNFKYPVVEVWEGIKVEAASRGVVG